MQEFFSQIKEIGLITADFDILISAQGKMKEEKGEANGLVQVKFMRNQALCSFACSLGTCSSAQD